MAHKGEQHRHETPSLSMWEPGIVPREQRPRPVAMKPPKSSLPNGEDNKVLHALGACSGTLPAGPHAMSKASWPIHLTDTPRGPLHSHTHTHNTQRPTFHGGCRPGVSPGPASTKVPPSSSGLPSRGPLHNGDMLASRPPTQSGAYRPVAPTDSPPSASERRRFRFALSLRPPPSPPMQAQQLGESGGQPFCVDESRAGGQPWAEARKRDGRKNKNNN